MKLTRHIAGALVEIKEQGKGYSSFELWINGAYKGEFHLSKTQGVMALVEAVLKTDPKQKELSI